MPRCPVCDEDLDVDQPALAYHVNGHFEGKLGTGVSVWAPNEPKRFQGGEDYEDPLDPSPSPEVPEDTCFICGYPLSFLDPDERQTHVNGCLDVRNTPERQTFEDKGDEDRDFVFSEQALQATGQTDNDNWVEDGWDGPARPGGWADWLNRKVDRGDKWWDPVDGSISATDIPANFSPGVMPVLTRILAAAVQQRLTRSVVLSRPAVHIKGVWGFDMGWGCGYRNALMALSALLLSQPAYRLVFSRNINGADPGVRRMQGWIEQAWGNGYDRVGRGQLKGKVLGTRKWIGTSDLYAMLSAKAIPCELYDFPKPKDAGDGPRSAHLALQQWVKKYFLEDGTPPSSHPAASLGQPTISAFDVMMGTGQGGAARGEAVRLSAKYPLILQHSGHSRTIIGYEEAANGTVNLLLLDPGRTMPRDVRSAGIDGLSHQRQQPFRPPLPGKISSSSSSRSFLHEPIPFSPPYTNGASEIIQLRHDEVGSNGTGPIFGLAEDEETDGGGWVRKRVDQVLQRKDTRQSYNPPWIGPVSKSLGYFRANLGSLSGHTEYQILAFTGGPILTDEQRERRKVISSTVVR